MREYSKIYKPLNCDSEREIFGGLFCCCFFFCSCMNLIAAWASLHISQKYRWNLLLASWKWMDFLVRNCCSLHCRGFFVARENQDESDMVFCCLVLYPGKKNEVVQISSGLVELYRLFQDKFPGLNFSALKLPSVPFLAIVRKKNATFPFTFLCLSWGYRILTLSWPDIKFTDSLNEICLYLRESDLFQPYIFEFSNLLTCNLSTCNLSWAWLMPREKYEDRKHTGCVKTSLHAPLQWKGISDA